jgi:hypothetical protein
VTEDAGDAGEVARLRAEVAELHGQLDDREASAERRLAWRQRGVGVLVVLASVCLLVSVVGVWVHQNVYDTDAWVSTVQDLPSDPAVAAALADRITNELAQVTQAEDRIRDLLPQEASILAGPITTGIEDLLREGVTRVIESDQFRTVWIEVNRIAHSQLVNLLDSSSGLLTTTEGNVRLNLLPIMGQVLDAVGDQVGDLIGRGDPPQIDRSTPPDEAVAALSSYLGVDLPEGFGQITVFQSEALAQAQDALVLLSRLVVVFVVLTIAFAAAAVALSHRRRRTVLTLGLGAAAAIAVAWALSRILAREVIAQIEEPQNQQVAREVLETVTGDLRSMSTYVLVLGLVVALVAFLLGDSRPARWVQGQLRVLGSQTAAAATRTAQGRTVATWVADAEMGLRAGGLVVAIALLLLVHVTWGSLLVLLVLLGLWQLAVSALASAGRRPAPPTSTPAPPAPPGAAA